MQPLSDTLVTPILIKTGDEPPPPPGRPAYYVISSNGLFLCREHQFFSSCVPASCWPSELAEQHVFLKPRYPKLPQAMLESIVGFFERIAILYGAEAGVLLAWDGRHIQLIIPRQWATVRQGWNGRNDAVGLYFDFPTDLPGDWTILGDVHSHVAAPAYASATDKMDETHQAGLHIVVGKIFQEPPQLYVAAVVDGTRFTLAPQMVVAHYERRRRDVPDSWIAQVQVATEPPGDDWYQDHPANYVVAAFSADQSQ